MNEAAGATCNEILRRLGDDHRALRARLRSARESGPVGDRARALEDLASFLSAQSRAEEEALLARALELEETRVAAMAALEEHELIDLMVDRARHSAHGEQLAARLGVLCELLERHLQLTERDLFPLLREKLSAEEREELGMRYHEAKSRNDLAPVFQMPVRQSLLKSESGRIGYIIAWLLGVPAWVLLLIFLIRGH